MVSSQIRFLSVYLEACSTKGSCNGVVSGAYHDDKDIYQRHEFDTEFFMWDTVKYVVPNRFKGFVRHIRDTRWAVFGGSEETRRLFISKIAHAQNPFTQTGNAGYLGIGPGLAADYWDHRKWSIGM